MIPVRDPALAIWSAAIDDFPVGGSPAEKLAALVPFAILAPSSHNAQPWLFRIADDALELRADRRRRLPVADPDDREMIIGCGAALGCLNIALRTFGYAGHVTVRPDPDHPELLARVGLGAPHLPDEHDHALFRAMHQRKTYRLPFHRRTPEPRLMSDLEAIARHRGAWFRIFQSDARRMALTDLVSEGDRRQMADPAFRRELASWLHSNRSRTRDGMPGWTHGFGPASAAALPLIVRTFDTGDGKSAHDETLALGSPLLAVLGTWTDTPADWMQTGRALIDLLLHGLTEGVTASYLNQPVEIPALRQRLASLVGQSAYPQLVLRMGYPDRDEPRRTPRRDVTAVLEGDS